MNKEIGSTIGNVFTYVLAAIQQNEVLQIIEFVLSALLTLVIVAYRVWHWYKEAKKDGKIDEKEIDELGKIIEDAKKESEDIKK